MRVAAIVAVVAFVMPLSAQTDREKQDRFNVLIQDNEALFDNISKKCEEEWPVDFRMQKDCRDRNRRATTNLRTFGEKPSPIPDRRLRSACWTGQTIYCLDDDSLLHE